MKKVTIDDRQFTIVIELRDRRSMIDINVDVSDRRSCGRTSVNDSKRDLPPYSMLQHAVHKKRMSKFFDMKDTNQKVVDTMLIFFSYSMLHSV